MKVLRAPNDNTVTRVTSVGEVHFENGIATEFTNEQAQYFTERQRGYELQEIEGDEPAKPAEPTAASIPPDESANDSGDSGEDGEGQTDEETGEADSTVTPPDGEQEETPTADNQSTGEGQAEDDALMIDITDADHATLLEAAGRVGIEVDDDWSTEDLREVLTAKATPTETGDESTGEGEGQSEGEGSPTTENEETAEPDETTEASQNTPDDAQSAPTDVSSGEGMNDANAGEGEAEEQAEAESETSEGNETLNEDDLDAAEDTGESQDDSTETDKTPEEPIELPTARDSRKAIAKWCRKHDVGDQGNKKELLERIYADQRFKK